MGIITSTGNKIITVSGKMICTKTAKLYGYSAGSRNEVFLDNEYIDSTSGVSLSVNKPIKYSQNPIFISGTNNDTWDHDKNYCCVRKINNTYHMWYAAVKTSTPVYLYVCRATSDNGINWTKPTDGLEIDGFENTNILLGRGSFDPQWIYDPDASEDKRYVLALEQRPGDTTGGAIYIYKSSNGTDFTLIKTLDPAGNPYIESKAIIKRPDGKWIAYYAKGQGTQDREIGAFLSDSTDIESTWTDQGMIITSSAQTSQKYTIGVFYENGLYYGVVTIYNRTTEKTWLDLYVSRDGINWSVKSTEWIMLGSNGTWDDSMYMGSSSMLRVGNEWWYYFAGFAEDHAHALPRDARIGIATIGYERIGQVSGKGTLITTSFTPSGPLYLNAFLREGSLKVELLNNSDEVINNYSKDDMDAIVGDSYNHEVKWNNSSIPTNQSIKLKFYFI